MDFPTPTADVTNFVDTMLRFIAWTLILADRADGPRAEAMEKQAGEILRSMMDRVWGNRAHSRQMTGADLQYVQAAVVEWRRQMTPAAAMD